MKPEEPSLLELLASAPGGDHGICGHGSAGAGMSWRQMPLPISGNTGLSRDARAGCGLPDFLTGHAWAMALLPETRAFLGTACAYSPYLAQLIRQSPQILGDMLHVPVKQTLGELRTPDPTTPLEPPFDAAYLTAVKRDLRLRKKKIALLLGLIDLSRCWSLSGITENLSDFADAACNEAFLAAMRWGAEAYPGHLSSEDISAKQNFIAVLAMGKLGARELNYSSDIDITVFYDPAEFDRLTSRSARHQAAAAGMPPARRAKSAREIATKITQQAATLLTEQTADGYVFRTDFRLRPNPGSTSPAVSIPSATEYYEVYGQNWERAAFIKARPVFGGTPIVRQLFGVINPFVWRRYLDFSAIQDVQAIKRQIHSAKGGAQLEIAGHDVKLGSGGIREIEFFVQTQQLILGGKNTDLQLRGTLCALDALRGARVITHEACRDLRDAYVYLRHLEHRLQVINDEQTHKLPRHTDGMILIAALMGYISVDRLLADIAHVLKKVSHHYSNLFDDEEMQDLPGSLVFTGVDHDPQTLVTLKKMGFSGPDYVSASIMSWHTGAVRASRLERARALLTRLVPVILMTIARHDDPDRIFAEFHRFIQLVPARTTAFSLFLNNPATVQKILDIINLSPRLAADLARRRHLIEALLDDGFLLGDGLGPETENCHNIQEIENIAQTDLRFEDAMNAIRRHAGTSYFQISARYLLSAQSADDVGRRYTHIADSCIASFLPIARRETERRHGYMPGALGVIAMGRLGARALTATSDIDIVFVYDAPFEAISDGNRALDATTYYMRFVRSMVTALTAATEEGPLLEVDMQLRPSGGAGPAAVSLSAFDKYYAHNAWTWEKMALTKGRVVAAEDGLGAALMARINDIICTPRCPEDLAGDVVEMRRKLLDAKKPTSLWDVRNQHGGLTDIEFIVQFLVLKTAPDTGWAPRNTQETINFLMLAGEIDRDTAKTLIDAHMVLDTIQQTGRVIRGGDVDPASLTREQGTLLISALETDDISDASGRLEGLYSAIRTISSDILGAPHDI